MHLGDCELVVWCVLLNCPLLGLPHTAGGTCMINVPSLAMEDLKKQPGYSKNLFGNT
jgi:hypothetical protein